MLIQSNYIKNNYDFDDAVWCVYAVSDRHYMGPRLNNDPLRMTITIGLADLHGSFICLLKDVEYCGSKAACEKYLANIAVMYGGGSIAHYAG